MNNWVGLVFSQSGAPGWQNDAAGIFAQIKGRVPYNRAADLVFFTVDANAIATEKMRLQGNGNLDIKRLNEIRFLSPGPPGTDDGEAINNAINALPAEGGIIMLQPGTYNVKSTIRINKSGVKLRGYGSDWPAAPYPSRHRTLLQWVIDRARPADQTFVQVGESADPVTERFVQDVELSDITLDGAGGAGLATPDSRMAAIGLLLKGAYNCVFRNFHVLHMRRSTAAPAISGGIGIKLTTLTVTTPPFKLNCDFNLFINCSAWGCAQSVVITNEVNAPTPMPQPNPSHNVFIGLNINYWGDNPGDTGLWLQVSDDTSFYRTFIFRNKPDGTGTGVLIEYPEQTGSNYFYHLAAGAKGTAAGGHSLLVRDRAATPPPPERNRNFVFGYDLEDGIEGPEAARGTPPVAVEATDYLGWIDTKGKAHGFKDFPIAPPMLAKGNQETGYCAAGMLSAADPLPGTAYAAESAINFKTVMSRKPTGIKLKVIGARNVLGVAIKWSDGSQSTAWFGPFTPGAEHTFTEAGKTASEYGFTLVVSSTDAPFAGQDFNLQATYTTVGN